MPHLTSTEAVHQSSSVWAGVLVALAAAVTIAGPSACAEGSQLDPSGSSGDPSGGPGASGGEGGSGGGTGGTGTGTGNGTDTTSGTDTGTGTGVEGCGDFELNTQLMDCQPCIEGACCDEMAVCDSSQPCGQLFDCIGACASGDQPCIDGCIAMYEPSIPDAQALISCYDTSCEVECQTFDICGSGYTTSDVVCDDCITGSCCVDFNACVDSASCEACLTGSGTNCDVNVLFQNYLNCNQSSCVVECPRGGVCGTGVTFNTQPCDDCAENNCCTFFQNCVSLSGGLAACIDCYNGVSCPNSQAQIAAQSASDCITQSCQAQCSN